MQHMRNLLAVTALLAGLAIVPTAHAQIVVDIGRWTEPLMVTAQSKLIHTAAEHLT